MAQQTGGELGQRIEGVAKLDDRRRIGQAKAEVVRGDHVIPVGQLWDQIAEHERAGGKPVQQHHRRGAGRPCLPVKHLPPTNRGIAVMDGRRFCSIWLDSGAPCCDCPTTRGRHRDQPKTAPGVAIVESATGRPCRPVRRPAG